MSQISFLIHDIPDRRESKGRHISNHCCSLMTFPNVLYEELKIFSHGNHGEINSCVLLVDKKAGGFWRRIGSRLRKRRIEGGVREKEEEEGGRIRGKETLFWWPHVMRFSLFTSMDTKSPPTVFIFYSIIILPSSLFGLHSQIQKPSSVLSLLFVPSLSFSLFFPLL